MGAPTLQQILADVDAGLVTFDRPSGFIGLPDTVAPKDGQVYRLAVIDAMSRSQVMLPPDARLLVLSTIGEHLRRNGNPDRYQSPRAFEARNGRFSASAVTR